MVQNWLLPSISDVLAQSEQAGQESVPLATVVEQGQQAATNHRLIERAKAQCEWQSAIATVEELLLQASAKADLANAECGEGRSRQGLVLAGPVPILSHPDLLASLHTGIFTTEVSNPLPWLPFQLPPAHLERRPAKASTPYELPLLTADPLAGEQFCLVFTPRFSLVMAAGEDQKGRFAFRFSFDPQDIHLAWAALRPRMLLTGPHQLGQLESLVRQFVPQPPDYRIVMHFGRQLLRNLPPPPAEPIQTVTVTPDPQPRLDASGQRWERLTKPEERSSKLAADATTPDLELLQALTHEIRTPLTTIRTLTKLLLKRRDLSPEVERRLEIIDHECTEQINRMELIFRAVELETASVKQVPVNLTSMSLAQVFQHSIPRWQKQAARRDLTLDVILPQNLPTVVSNPNLLDQVLTGLVENFTRSLPAGGRFSYRSHRLATS